MEKIMVKIAESEGVTLIVEAKDTHAISAKLEGFIRNLMDESTQLTIYQNQ